MPSSLQSALSASASDCVAGSDCDREPARDNVFPGNVDDDRRAAACAGSLHCDTRVVDRNELALDHGFGVAGTVADVDAVAVEAVVVLALLEGSLGAGARDLELVRAVDEACVVEERSGDLADTFAVVDADGLGVVDGDAQRAT